MVYHSFTRVNCFIYFNGAASGIYRNYHVEEAEKDLTQLADKIAVIIENHEDQPLARSITWELADNLTSIAIIQDDKHVWYSPNDDNHLSSITLEQIKHDRICTRR